MSKRIKPSKRREIRMPPRSYHPRRAELREGTEMPEADVGTIRGASFTPARVIERDPKED